MGAALFGATASVAGAAATIAPIVTAASGVAGIASAFKQMSAQNNIPSLMSSPIAPSYTSIQAQETQNILKANQKRTKTILTNPLSETEGAGVQRKALVAKTGL